MPGGSSSRKQQQCTNGSLIVDISFYQQDVPMMIFELTLVSCKQSGPHYRIHVVSFVKIS
jgi:hypothetical protein